MVESIHISQKPSELTYILIISILTLEIVKHIDKITHNIWKNHDTKQHKECNKDSFRITSWVEVTKSYSWKSCKWVIDKYQNISCFCLPIQTESINEIFLMLSFFFLFLLFTFLFFFILFIFLCIFSLILIIISSVLRWLRNYICLILCWIVEVR